VAERIRVQKLIANAGLMSRRKAEEAIAEGRVSVGDRVAVLGDRADVEVDRVTLDGVPLPVNPEIETHLLYKPVGVVSTADDPQGRRTVVDLIPSEHRLYPVGRLDLDSEGLILVSNDGVLTNLVTHPRHGITKKYMALVRGIPDRKAVRLLTTGVQLDDGPAKAESARLVESHGNEAMIEIVMLEGRNREVRRMMDAIGHPVLRLVRTAIGTLSDPRLTPGESRRLTGSEVHRLMEAAR
jgi:pseudouridine synthase